MVNMFSATLGSMYAEIRTEQARRGDCHFAHTSQSRFRLCMQRHYRAIELVQSESFLNWFSDSMVYGSISMNWR